MKYASIHTTSLEPIYNNQVGQLLEVAVVIEDTDEMETAINDLPVFHRYLPSAHFTGSPQSLTKAKVAISRIASLNSKYSYTTIHSVSGEMGSFLSENGICEEIIIATDDLQMRIRELKTIPLFQPAPVDNMGVPHLGQAFNRVAISSDGIDVRQLYRDISKGIKSPTFLECTTEAGIHLNEGLLPGDTVGMAQLYVKLIRHKMKKEKTDEAAQ